jgi:hypothetical protein
MVCEVGLPSPSVLLVPSICLGENKRLIFYGTSGSPHVLATSRILSAVFVMPIEIVGPAGSKTAPVSLSS